MPAYSRALCSLHTHPTDPILLGIDNHIVVPQARGIDVAPNGDLLVLNSETSRIVAVFEDDNGDTHTVTLTTLAGLNHAVKYRDGYVYASTHTNVYRYVFVCRFFVDDFFFCVRLLVCKQI